MICDNSIPSFGPLSYAGVIVAFPGSLVFHERPIAEPLGLCSASFTDNALLDLLADLARLCQSQG